MDNLPFTLRPYQERTRIKTNAVLNKGGNPLIVMDTGTGKTKTDVAIISDRIKLGKRIFVICPNKEVFDQWLSELSFMNPGYINKEGLRGNNRLIYVCMMKSLNNNLSLIPESLYPDEIHTDEAHSSACITDVEIYEHFHKARRLGLTATPLRLDNKPLGNHYTEIISEINIKEAFKNKFLTQYFYIGAKDRLDLIPSDDEDIDSKKQAELLGTPQIVGQAIEIYEQYGDGKPWIVPCCTYEHAKTIRDEFRNAGWISEHLHGKLGDFERDNIIKRTREMKINVITTVLVGVVGVDIPSLAGIIWLRLTGSLTIWKQFNGRVIRLFDNKEWSFIADLAGNAVLHGLPDKIYHWDLEEGVLEEEDDSVSFQFCPDCDVPNSIDNIECHYCGCPLGDEAKKEGTCRRCSHWGKLAGCDFSDSIFKPCPIWLFLEGCPSYTRKSRKLMGVVDGELIALTENDGVQELKKQTRNKKEEIKQTKEKEKMDSEKLETVSDFEKLSMIRKGLFVDGNRRSLFAEALRG